MTSTRLAVCRGLLLVSLLATAGAVRQGYQGLEEGGQEGMAHARNKAVWSHAFDASVTKSLEPVLGPGAGACNCPWSNSYAFAPGNNQLGEGTFGKVVKVVERDDLPPSLRLAPGQTFAAKHMHTGKATVKGATNQMLHNEVEILSARLPYNGWVEEVFQTTISPCKFQMKNYYEFEDCNDLILVQPMFLKELADTLENSIAAWNMGFRMEPVRMVNIAWYIGKQVAAALWELHQNGYIHGDLKLENIMVTQADFRELDSSDVNRKLKAWKQVKVVLIDFGLATTGCQSAASFNNGCTARFQGTMGYTAPGILGLKGTPQNERTPYGYEVDWFAFGAVMAEIVLRQKLYFSDEDVMLGRWESGMKQTSKHFRDGEHEEFRDLIYQIAHIDNVRNLEQQRAQMQGSDAAAHPILNHPFWQSEVRKGQAWPQWAHANQFWQAVLMEKPTPQPGRRPLCPHNCER